MTHLMQPRYKVIADYPKSPYPVGTIINAGGQSEDLLYCNWQGPRCRDYPHLFKSLQWWEDRQPEDMPEYVKYRFMPESEEMVFRVEKHFTSSIGDMNPYGYIPNGDYGFCSYSKSIPATLEEYTAYQTRHV